MRSSLMLAVLLLLMPLSLSAAPQQLDLFEEGEKFLAAGEYQAAYEYFFEAFKKDPANQDISFYLGQAAFAKGDFESAIMAFDRILIVTPDANRVKLELARCHFQLGAFEVAKQYFDEVLATEPPGPVKEKIKFFITSMKSLEKDHFFNGMVAVGVNWDDNAGLAPYRDTVAFDGGDITIQGISTKEADHIMNSTLVLNHLYKIGDTQYTWKTTGINYNALYQNRDIQNLDANYFSITTGPLWQTDTFMWELYGAASLLEMDDLKYHRSSGGGSNFMYMFNPQVLLSVNLRLEDKDFLTDSTKDANNIRLSAGPLFILDKNRISVSFSTEKEGAEGVDHSYDRFDWSLRYDRQLPHDFGIFGSVGYENTKYRAPDEFTSLDRRDTIQTTALGISRTFWRSEDQSRSFTVELSHTFTDAESTVDLYAYRKNLTAASASYTF